MLRTLISALVVALLLASPAQADNGHRHHHRDGRGYDYARVIDVDPIVRRQRVRVEREVCWDERVRVDGAHPGDRAGAAVMGAVIGGVVGHEFGERDPRAGTLVGAAVGAALGHELAAQRHHRSRYVTERRCAVEPDFEYHEAVTGYQVRYRYRGRIYHTRTERHPGKRIRVRVDVSPVHWHGY
ncbi:glycine zipper 2TM domain-containing protein [Marinobacterium aestuariivivens]|uniref:Glycine zipper 2TM domain-containing protein n=1 Tax=Marinobacterium aestuariivivens TaxID=1698799 RepID=A0ABW1ZYU0_9GAMM